MLLVVVVVVVSGLPLPFHDESVAMLGYPLEKKTPLSTDSTDCAEGQEKGLPRGYDHLTPTCQPIGCSRLAEKEAGMLVGSETKPQRPFRGCDKRRAV